MCIVLVHFIVAFTFDMLLNNFYFYLLNCLQYLQTDGVLCQLEDPDESGDTNYWEVGAELSTLKSLFVHNITKYGIEALNQCQV